MFAWIGKRAAMAATGVLLAGSLGCYTHHRVYREPEPPVVEEDVVVTPAPPPPEIVEAVPPAPQPDFVWVGGYYEYDRGGYVWRPGHYERRPYAHAHWVAGRWDHNERGYYYRRGHWG